MANAVQLTSPVGRLVTGSLYKSTDKDFDGNPLVYKTGSNAGQPRVQYFIGLAVPKTKANWYEEEWGAAILRVGQTEFPQAFQRGDFAWKVEDGDSTVVNKKNKRPCDKEGHPGHWILKFSGSYAPTVVVFENGAWRQEMTEGFVKTGYWVRVAFSVAGNGNQNNPGVYLNYDKVAFAAYGPEIVTGISAEEAFGSGPISLPQGASTVPLGGAPLPNPSSTPANIAPPAGGNSQMPASALPATPTPTSPTSVPNAGVTPNPGFLQGPATGVPGANTPGGTVPAVPTPTSPSKRMTAKAGGASYTDFTAKGWTDEMMIAQGYLEI